MNGNRTRSSNESELRTSARADIRRASTRRLPVLSSQGRSSGSTRRTRGFSLVEAAVSIALAGGLLVVSLDLVGTAAAGRKNMGDHGRAQLLALGLMSEIVEKAYEDPEEPVFGVEPDEVTGTRQSFDDVDDYHEWSASPPKIRDGMAMADLTSWQRDVTVEYVDPDDLETVMVSDTGVKRITVSVRRDSKVLATMVAVRTNAKQTDPG